MSEFFPEGNETRVKDFIVSKAPLLRTFIDKYAEKDPEMWNRMVDEVFVSNKEEIISLVGEDVVHNDVSAYLKMANDMGVFNPDVERSTRTGLIFCIAWMGYEIGSEKETDLFVDDVLSQLYFFDTLKKTVETKDYVKEVLRCGVMWKKEMSNKVPRQFKDFFDNLKFEL